MKKLIYFLLITLIISSCEKDKGKVTYKIKFTTDIINLKSAASDTLYTQFGNYITSLTPQKFTANIWSLGYLDRVMVPGTNQANSLEYVNQQNGCPGCLKPENHPDRYVDFSGNSTINVIPGIGGNVDGDRNTFQDDKVDFIYFYFIPYYLYQEVEIPAQYAGVQIDMFQPTDQDPAAIEGNILKVKHRQMIKKVYPNANMNQYIQFIFGNCSSTYVVNPNGEGIPLSDDSPLMNVTETNLTIRSNLYEKMIFNSPDKDSESAELNGVLSFNIRGLIQVYAGADNLPYTRDDIFVYAPRFWERIRSSLNIN